jgi:carboxyl-terminal processing protease
MSSKAEDDGDATEGGKFPYGIEPVKLETLNVIRDMIALNKGAPATAKADEAKK